MLQIGRSSGANHLGPQVLIIEAHLSLRSSGRERFCIPTERLQSFPSPKTVKPDREGEQRYSPAESQQHI